MKVDLAPIFQEYEALVGQVDRVFQKVATEFTQEVRCRQGCSDCCHAIFDISLVEAMYMNARFQELEDSRRTAIMVDADKADRKAYVLKKKLCPGVPETAQEQKAILRRVGQERIRCPLLDEGENCRMYAARPMTCRVYGIPLEFDGESHTCGISGFQPGLPYPAVRLDRIQDALLDLSTRIVSLVGSPYRALNLLYVPVSSALLTVYDDSFFGLVVAENTEEGGVNA